MAQAVADDGLATLLSQPDCPKGGIVAVPGGGDVSLLVEVADAGQFLVHALEFDQATVDEMRNQLVSQKRYGIVSVMHNPASRLVYTGNLVNVVVITNPEALSQAAIDASEINRVLAPHGLVLVKGSADQELVKTLSSQFGSTPSTSGSWTCIAKPKPKEMDEWTHEMQGPDGDSALDDTIIKPVTSLQWRQGPIWKIGYCRSRTASGKNFYNDRTGTRNTCVLYCRDAFNGMLLWQKPVGIESSFTQMEWSG